MSFEQIGEPARRVICSVAQHLSDLERQEARERAKMLTRAAIRAETMAKDRAQNVRNLAIKGPLRALAFFVALADQYDDAVLRRRACERIERGYL